MRICQFSLCDEAATVWFRGEAFCGTHALKRWGKRDVVLAARFSEIHRALQASERGSLPSAGSSGEGTPLATPSGDSRPRGRASVVGSLTASEPSPTNGAGDRVSYRNGEVVTPSPAPLSEAELLDILERENWGEPWA